MLVDDDSDDQLIFEETLNELKIDIECVMVNNGVEALQMLKSSEDRPSLIFLDLNMPFMNGFECLSELKKEDALKEITVIIFTTSDNPTDHKKSMDMGANWFLTKPSDIRILKKKLTEIFDMDFAN